jgi:hypothetical protein
VDRRGLSVGEVRNTRPVILATITVVQVFGQSQKTTTFVFSRFCFLFFGGFFFSVLLGVCPVLPFIFLFVRRREQVNVAAKR